MHYSIAIVGSSSAIGHALAEHISNTLPDVALHTFSRQSFTPLKENWRHYFVDYIDESSLADAAKRATEKEKFDLIVVTTGILHNADIQPEKSMRDLNAEHFSHIISVNTIVPALIAKHFLPHLTKERRAVFAALSARVGSLSDNKTGGWHAYRASKVALNMLIKNFAIEMRRTHKQAIIAGLHPGTVDSPLSKPFQAHVPKDKLFTPAFSAERLFHVITQLKTENSGHCFAWDGKEIEP
tara:strand:- start:846 stop:1565 length:720 start_codon:yes stop_codon:yes gene_type:complete